MRNLILAAGAAALAMAVPALADPKGQGGKGQGASQKGGGPQAKGSKGGGNADRGRHDAHSIKADRGERQAKSGSGNDKSPRQAQTDLAKPDKAEKTVKAAKIDKNPGPKRVDVDDDIRIVRRDFSNGPFFRNGRQPFDCPPGLDRKDNGCMPPGQAMKLVGAPLLPAFADSRLPFQYRNWYPDSDDFLYRAGDGFIYRVDRSNNLVDGLIPLFGTGGYYTMGDPWPQPYNFYNVPYQYQSFWPDNGNFAYRYGDGAIYRIDPATQAVSGIVALLAGDMGVGAPLPMGYNTYNVPLAYRAQYYDTPDAWYRYNDGYIYRVDPTTRLITAVIDAII